MPAANVELTPSGPSSCYPAFCTAIPLALVPTPSPPPALTQPLCSRGAGWICRKKKKLEKQNSLEYMDQNDDSLKPEGELPAAHSPNPSSLRSVGFWEKADPGHKEAGSAGPLPPPTARRLQSRERCSQGRTPRDAADPLVEVVAGPGPAPWGAEVGAGRRGGGFWVWASHPILRPVQQTPSPEVESRSGRTPWRSMC